MRPGVIVLALVSTAAAPTPAVAAGPGEPGWAELAVQARRLADAGEWGQALATYRRAIREAPQREPGNLTEAEQADQTADLFLKQAELRVRAGRDSEDDAGLVCTFAAAYKQAEWIKTQHYKTPFHPEVVKTLDRLAGVWQLCGPPLAAEYFEAAVNARSRATVVSAPELADAWDRLGDYRRQDMADFPGSLAAYERARAVREKAFGKEDARVTANAAKAAWSAYFGGDAAAARRLLDEAVRLRQKALGPEHASVGEILDASGMVLAAAGDAKQAAAQLESAVRILDRSGNPAQRSQALLDLAGLRSGLGNVEAALTATQRAVDVLQASRGSGSPELAEPLERLADVLEQAGRAEQAAQVRRQLADVKRRMQ